MRNRISGWWPLHRAPRNRSSEPGAALFQGLRISLTLWYCAVLFAALVLFGVVLYFVMNLALLTPVERDAAAHAYAHAHMWFSQDSDHACSSSDGHGPNGPPPGQGFFRPETIICFDQNGILLQNQNTTGYPTALLSNTLALSALKTGRSASDTIEGGSSVGKIYLYALPVPNPDGNGYQGVLMVGESIQVQENILSLLPLLLLAVGGGALIAAGIGGLFLANRALVPARLAWDNQQRFIADASHELGTPLTLLRADAEVLLRSSKRLDADDAALLEDIVTEANHMGNLARNMLTLARLDHNANHSELEAVNLTRVAQAGARRIQALAEQKGIAIQTDFDESSVVIGDQTLLEQAILALVDNAIKYNQPGGRITIRTAVQNEHALLEVSDTGIGIPPEHLPHLGERFYRVDKARSRSAGGTGLGLSIVQGIATKLGGTLHLNSMPGQGTTVTLTLPQAHKTLSSRERDTVQETLPPQSSHLRLR
jgi:signal transduction histidine kinase